MKPLRIGLSACFFHADPKRPIFKGMTLLYEEQSMTDYVMKHGALPLLLPQPSGQITTSDLLDQIDGVIFQGGSDVCPKSYGEEPIRPEWNGDYVRDNYEVELLKGALERGIPILGICRGLQLINVGLGGTLFQDISTQNENALVHRDWDIYDKNEHDVILESGSLLSEIYKKKTGRVNSIHHQGIKDLAGALTVEAVSTHDGIIEAVRLAQKKQSDPFLLAVQWHPEFQDDEDTHLLAAEPVIHTFLDAVRERTTATK